MFTLYLSLQPTEDVAVIFAEPSTVDLISVISDPALVLLIQALLWNKVSSKLKQTYILVQLFGFLFSLSLISSDWKLHGTVQLNL
jgi:hypothetical protein